MEKCLEKKDWDGLSRAYYDLGVAAMDRGDFNKAVLWLSRADTVYSASDKVYSKTSKNRLFHKEIVTDCSDRIGTLEEEDLLYNNIPAEMDEKVEELEDIQARVLGLLSMARLVRLGQALSKLPGCEVLGRLDWAVSVVLKSFQEPITQEEVSSAVGLSAAYFSALFKKVEGEGFAKYLINVRMEQAKVLLRETNTPVSKICQQVGYNDLKHFTHTFEKATGVKPSVYRKMYG